MSLPDSRSTEPAGVLVPKPRTSVYTVLLGIAACALALGSLFLFLEITEYGSFFSWPWLVR